MNNRKNCQISYSKIIILLINILLLSSCSPPDAQRVLPTLIQFPTLTSTANVSPTPLAITNNNESSLISTPTAVVSVVPEILYVNQASLPIFDCPSVECETIMTLQFGQSVNVIQSDLNWYEVINDINAGFVINAGLSTLSELTVLMTETVSSVLAPVTVASETQAITTNMTAQATTALIQTNTTNSQTEQPSGPIFNISTNPPPVNSTINVTSPSPIPPQNPTTATPTIRIFPSSTQNLVRNTRTSTATATRTPSPTATSSPTTSPQDLPDVPDSVLTPVIVQPTGLPTVITITPENTPSLPTPEEAPTTAPPGS